MNISNNITYDEENKTMLMKTLPDKSNFSLSQTFDCGQCFRFDADESSSYKGVVGKKTIKIEHTDEGFLFHNTVEGEENIIYDFLDLDLDYTKIIKDFSKNKVMKEAISYAPGIRILKQDTWEALISFIFSQNNNIKRIKGIVRTFCEEFGEELPDGEFAFPTLEVTKKLTIDDLAPLRSGFRAKYVVDAAQKVADGTVDLDALKTMPMDEARLHLQQIKGVGPKVAECVLLYGAHRLEAFPMDVWMKRAMKTLFNGELPDELKEYGGIAQQFIFHYSRMNPDIFKAEEE